MNNKIKIDGDICTHLTKDEFIREFLYWLESKDISFSGDISLKDERYLKVRRIKIKSAINGWTEERTNKEIKKIGDK